MWKFCKKNWVYITGGFLVLIFFFLRLYHLTILPVFADEAIYIRWSQIMKAEETLRFLPLSDGKEPLFMWLVIPFLKVFSDPLLAGRFVSVLSGFGTLVGVTFLSWLLFKSKKVALAAALIYSLSPFSFFFDRLALADSLLSMFGVWVFIFSYLAFKFERLDFAMIAGFFLGGAWLTKSPALFFAIMVPSLWIFADWKKKGNFFKKFLKLLGLYLPILAIGYGLYNILRLGPNFSVIAKRNLDYVWPLGHFLTSPLDPLKPFLDRSRQWLQIMGPWGVLLLWLTSYLVGWKKFWKELLVLTIWFFVPIFVQSEFARVLTARYILFSIPFLCIIAGSVFATANRNWLKVSSFVLAVFVAQALIFDRWLLTNPEKANLPRSERSGYLEEWTAGQGIRESSDYFKKLQIEKPDRKIVVGTEGYFGTLPDGLEIYLNDTPSITVIGIGLEFDHLSSQLSDSKKAGNLTFLLVNKSRFAGEPEKFGFDLIKEFPKAEAPDGSRDSLLLLELVK